MLPAGCRLVIDAGTVFICDFARSSPINEAEGVFIVSGDNVSIITNGIGHARVVSRQTDHSRYAVMSQGHSNLKIQGISSVDCAHVFCEAATDTYTKIGTSGAKPNVVKNVQISDGGARFSRAVSEAGHAACTIRYTLGFSVTDCFYENVRHGVQWWGGDANPKADGAPINERKCGDGRIERIAVQTAGGASVWGSMGRDIEVIDCTGADLQDVGFDAEGSVRITFIRCTQQRAKNGCFSAFFSNQAVAFIDCVGIQERYDFPLFRIYNEPESFDNQDILVSGGRFECTDKQPGTFDDKFGPTRSLTVTGAHFVNVALKFDHNRNHKIIIENNKLTFPKPPLKQITAIRVGLTHRLAKVEGYLRVSNNVIVSPSEQLAGSTGISIYQNDPHGVPMTVVRDNRIIGFPSAIVGEWASLNQNGSARFAISSNTLSSATIQILNGATAKPAIVVRDGNRRLDGVVLD
jgi:hypothetical protein